MPDKTKKDLWDATIIYWYEAEKRKFHQAAFYTNDEVYFVDDYALSQVEANLESVARDNLKKHNIVVKKLDIAKATDLPNAISTPTKEPTPEATMQVIPIPTPIITTAPTPTPTPTPVFIPTETPAPVTFADIDLQSMKDDELLSALEAIKEEQRSRINTRIVLDTNNISLAVGKTRKIEAQITDIPPEEVKAPKLKWSSSDNKIATCSNGVIKAVAPGKAIITCSITLGDGTYVFQDCEVQVIVLASSLTVEKKTISISIDEEYKPEYIVKPNTTTNKTLMFTSDDETIARVDSNGTITGVSQGNTKITATTTDGSKKSIVISVKVTFDAYMKKSSGRAIYNSVVFGENVENELQYGDSDWYVRESYVNSFSFEVDSIGKDGNVCIITLMDTMRTGKKELFYKVLENVFSGDDLDKATKWVKKNLGKEASTKIGDANILLRLTVAKYPILNIVDDEHLDWV